MNTSIQELPEMRVAFIHNVGPYAGDKELFSRLFTQLSGWIGERNAFTPETVFLSAYYDDPSTTPPEEHRLDVCAIVSEGIEGSGDVKIQTLPGGKYMVGSFTAKGPEDYQKAWNDIWEEELPKHNQIPDFERPFYEIYRSDSKSDPEGKHEVEICVAVK